MYVLRRRFFSDFYTAYLVFSESFFFHHDPLSKRRFESIRYLRNVFLEFASICFKCLSEFVKFEKKYLRTSNQYLLEKSKKWECVSNERSPFFQGLSTDTSFISLKGQINKIDSAKKVWDWYKIPNPQINEEA